MSYDLKLTDKDLAVTSTGDLVLAKTKQELVRQWLEVSLSLMLAEWEFDTSQGTDWLEVLSGRNNKAAIDTVIKDIILNTTYVESIIAYESKADLKNKQLSIDTQIKVEGGEVILLRNLGVG